MINDTANWTYEKEPTVLDDSVEYLLNEYRARQFWERRSYREAMAEAAEAALKAHDMGDSQGFWRMSLLKAECQVELGLMREFALEAKLLVEDEKIAGDPAIKARATALYARALQCLGQVGESLRVAKEAAAIELANSVEISSHFDTRHALIASLADSGRLVEAWDVAESLLDLVNEETPPEAAGLAYWSVGNVAFLMENNVEGAKWHDEAAIYLSPSNDVYLWAQFNKASAHVRLAANLMEPATLECIERAELAISVSGGSPMDEMELALVRSHWLLLTGEYAESLQRLEEVLDDRDLLSPPILAEAEQLIAMALMELGRIDDALDSARRSEKMFIVLGATRMADVSRELIDKIESKIDNS
ncbi:hypothetical protein J2M53_12850 [Arthrobacter sp. zg-ZUI100]|uniref:hypothetical protein n=1 Tax=Arthrobacter jiangjiafuii TaxID=2817475 RepID=UPI001AEE70E8|nr:hypothetical protein [Arthrobacter jiangjiafuii]MBP3037132.1 hypothetical protein [Arthrobacter jiangjiafuii]